MSTSITFNVQPSRVRRMLLRPLGLVERDVQRRVRRVETAARRMAPGSMGQGQQIKGRVERGPEGYRGVVTVQHPAAVYVTKGTPPHVIRPKRAKALRFRVGGRTVFARVVNHPGTKANDFLSKALRQAL